MSPSRENQVVGVFVFAIASGLSAAGAVYSAGLPGMSATLAASAVFSFFGAVFGIGAIVLDQIKESK
jgi:hypothetical protein